MSTNFYPQKQNYSLMGFMVAAGLLILLFAIGPFIISMWVLTSILIIAGAILSKFFRAQNEDRY